MKADDIRIGGIYEMRCPKRLSKSGWRTVRVIGTTKTDPFFGPPKIRFLVATFEGVAIVEPLASISLRPVQESS